MLRCVYANETVPHTHVLVWLKTQRRTWRPGRWFKERATVNFLKSRKISDICEPVEARDLRMTLNSTHDQLHINRGTIHQVIPGDLWKSVICAKFVSQSHGWPWPVNQTLALLTWSHASRRPLVCKVKASSNVTFEEACFPDSVICTRGCNYSFMYSYDGRDGRPKYVE